MKLDSGKIAPFSNSNKGILPFKFFSKNACVLVSPFREFVSIHSNS